MKLENEEDLLGEFYACELKWAKLRIPTDDEVEKLSEVSTSLEKETQILKNRQPHCWELLGRYEAVFSSYDADVADALRANDRALHKFGAFVFTERAVERLKNEIDTLRVLRDENKHLLTNRLIYHTTRVLFNLQLQKRELEKVKSEFFLNLEKMRQTLENNHSILNSLRKPTHEWIMTSSLRQCSKCSITIRREKTVSVATSEQGLERKPKPVRDPDGYLPSS